MDVQFIFFDVFIEKFHLEAEIFLVPYGGQHINTLKLTVLSLRFKNEGTLTKFQGVRSSVCVARLSRDVAFAHSARWWPNSAVLLKGARFISMYLIFMLGDQLLHDFSKKKLILPTSIQFWGVTMMKQCEIVLGCWRAPSWPGPPKCHFLRTLKSNNLQYSKK